MVHRNQNRLGSCPVHHSQMLHNRCNRKACKTLSSLELRQVMLSSSSCFLVDVISECPVFV
ncbi:hypothetical protein Hanom_Chr09g00808851 [Helianthus anomalus]